MAENYGIAKAFIQVVGAPWLASVTAADVAAVVAAHMLPIKIEDGKLVHDDADKRAILRLLESDWLKARVRTAPRARERSANTTEFTENGTERPPCRPP